MTPCRPRSPVHDDVHVAAVSLEAGAQQDLITSGEAHLHGEVGYHMGVGLQHGLQLQQGLLGLLPAQERPQSKKALPQSPSMAPYRAPREPRPRMLSPGNRDSQL